MAASHLRYTLHVRDDVVLVLLSGELDIAVQDQLDDLLAAARIVATSAVVVDLTDVTFLDGSAASVLEAVSDSDGAAPPLALAAPSRTVARMLHLLGVDRRLPVFDGTSNAVSCYSRCVQAAPTVRGTSHLRLVHGHG